MEVVRALGRVQLDPTNAVAPSHLLVLWSRLGRFDLKTLERLRSTDKRIFELDAFLVPSEDYPMLAAAMAMSARGGHVYAAAGNEWIADNQRLRRHVLRELDRRGPLGTGEFEDVADPPGGRAAGPTSAT